MSEFDAIVNLILPYSETESSRRMLMLSAFHDHPEILDKVDYSGATLEYATQLIRMLQVHGEVTPGKQALWHLLLVLKGFVGSDHQATISNIINRHHKSPTSASVDNRPPSRLDAVKRQHLQETHALKLKQFEQVAEALRLNLNPSDTAKLELQLAQLEKDLRTVETQLIDLNSTP
jgi:hypothetical protein